MTSWDRRRVLTHLGAAVATGTVAATAVGAGAGTTAPAPRRPLIVSDAAGCPIGWSPNALAPVFYGHRDYATADGAPEQVRVYFPSLGSNPRLASLLSGCGGYPLVLLLHGHCPKGSNEHLRWEFLSRQLARSGYVVAAPTITDIATFPPAATATQDRLAQVLAWMRSGWDGRQALLPPPATGLIGHSHGALHAGILASGEPVAAMVSLSGGWRAWHSEHGPRPIESPGLPRLFTWGTSFDEVVGARLLGAEWAKVPRPKHRVEFPDGDHFDYLRRDLFFPRPCSATGTCQLIGAATGDAVTMFLARYLPPEGAPGLPGQVPDLLVPPPALELTPQQQAYAGGHLIGWKVHNDTINCTPPSVSFEPALDTVVPDVRQMPLVLASAAVQAAGLVPEFHGSPQPSQFVVVHQSPAPGTPVPSGSTVHLVLGPA